MTDETRFDPARAILSSAVAARVFPAAVVEVGSGREVYWREAFGRLTFDQSAASTREDTMFDLASLTKPIATTSVVMQLAAQARIDLNEKIDTAFPEWHGADRDQVTVRDLLEHASGLPARLVDRSPRGRREFEHEICGSPLEYPTRTQSIYSDLGFILLGFMAEDRGDASLATQFDAILARLHETEGESAPGGPGFIGFDIPADARNSTAPTLPLEEDERRGERLIGRVHDNYAAALGGIAGHAGLFGNAAAIGAFARVMLRVAREEATFFPPFTYPWVMKMIRKSTVPGSSRALGWDTMLPTSSCGSGMSFAAFGHVGYTGTSVWIDPILDKYFVLLTNRACGGGTLEAMRDVRRSFHDALVGVDFEP